jgi:hypothetical protein
VILITTKSGKRGQGIGVEINSNYTFENPSVNPTFQNTWGGGYDDDYSAMGTETIDGEEVLVWPGWLLDQWGGRMDGRSIIYDYARDWGVQSYTPQPIDNIENFYRTGTTSTNTVSISGGNERSSARLSFSNMNNKSIVPNNTLDRQTVTLRAFISGVRKIIGRCKNQLYQTGGK